MNKLTDQEAVAMVKRGEILLLWQKLSKEGFTEDEFKSYISAIQNTEKWKQFQNFIAMLDLEEVKKVKRDLVAIEKLLFHK